MPSHSDAIRSSKRRGMLRFIPTVLVAALFTSTAVLSGEASSQEPSETPAFDLALIETAHALAPLGPQPEPVVLPEPEPTFAPVFESAQTIPARLERPATPPPSATPEPTAGPTPTTVAAAPPGSTPGPTSAPTIASEPADGGSVLSPSGDNILGIDLTALPTSGAAYERVKGLAGKSASLNYGDIDGAGNDVLLAKAIMGDRAGVLAMVRAAKGSLHSGINSLAASRNLAATAIALNLVNAHEEDGWLLGARDMGYANFGALDEAALKANNHGSAADQSLVAIDLHLNDRGHLESQVIPAIRQRLGEDMGIKLQFGDSVQADPSNPVAIGLPGTIGDGTPLDGLLLEEQRRGSGFPNCDGYNFGASGQMLLTLWLLEMAGYDAQDWGQRAIHRVFERLVDIGCAPTGDDRWQGHMYNALAGRVVLPEGVGDGKTFGVTDLLFGD